MYQCHRLTSFNSPLELQSLPIPSPKSGEVLIKMEMAGVCHTDLHVMGGDWQYKSKLPLTLGHEGVGKIYALGEHVDNVKIGDRVCTAWLQSSCQACEHCWSGWENSCESQANTGFSSDGSFSEFVVAPANFCVKVPNGLTNAQAVPITCAGVTTYKALKESKVQPGQWVVIVGGAGGLGHVGIQYAKAMGMRVIGLDVGDDKIEFMKSVGSDIALDGTLNDLNNEIIKVTGGGAHGALILVPSQKCISGAVDYLRRRGTIVLVALPPGDFSANTVNVVLKCITIKGSLVGTRQDLTEALNLAADGKIKCNVEVRKFSEVNEILDDLAKGKISGRVVMDIGAVKNGI